MPRARTRLARLRGAVCVADLLYRRIADDLRRRIESGELGPGAQIPTEIDLQDQYEASRNTVRDAIKSLIALGLVITRPGQDTFVADKREPFVTTLTDDEPFVTTLTGDLGHIRSQIEGLSALRTAIADAPSVSIVSHAAGSLCAATLGSGPAKWCSVTDLFRTGADFVPAQAKGWSLAEAGCLEARGVPFLESLRIKTEPAWVFTHDTGHFYLVRACWSVTTTELGFDVRKALLWLINGILAALSLMLVRVLAALSGRASVFNFVRLMIAACLRYGLRHEPEEDDSLLTRRHQSSQGRVPI